ncbi:MAG: alpha/beta hydrolase [Archangium sp.]
MNDRSSRFIDANGIKLHLEEQGSGPPVLLLHGLGSSAFDWSRVAPLLPGFRLLMPDARGHGQSDKPAGKYGVALSAHDIAAMLDALGLKSVHVVGLSMGGMIGFQLAVDRPDLVGSLTAINSGPSMAVKGIAMRVALTIRTFVIRTFGPAAMARMIAKKLFPEPSQQAMRDEVEKRIGANDRDVYLRSTQGLIGWTMEERLGELKCPVLVVGSEHDYTTVDFKRAYTDKIKGARLEVIKGSRHFATFDAPEAVAALLNPFLQSAGTERTTKAS